MLDLTNLTGFNASSGGGGDPDAEAFFTAAGITDQTQKDAVTQLVTDLKGYGIWDKASAIYPIVGGTASSHSYNLKDTASYQITWVNSPTHSSTGVDYNGTTQYGDTNLNQLSVIAEDSEHFSVYILDNIDEVRVDIGVTTSGGTGSMMYTRFGTNFTGRNQGASASNSAVATDARGLSVNSRVNSTEIILSKNGSSSTFSNASDVARQNLTYFVGARNGAGTPASHASKKACFYSIGAGLTTTECGNLYTAVQTFQTTLGRNV